MLELMLARKRCRPLRCHLAVLQHGDAAVGAAEQIEHVRFIQPAKVHVFVKHWVLLPHFGLDSFFQPALRQHCVAVLTVLRFQDLDDDAVDFPESVFINRAMQRLSLLGLNATLQLPRTCVLNAVP